MLGQTRSTVRLDRSGDPWVGTFPGLGTVQVWADGRIEATAEPGEGPDADEPLEQRHAALVHGWGEPLSLARRGFDLAVGAAVVAPGAERCLLVVGDPHDTPIILLGLAARGWRVLADRLTPITWGGGPVGGGAVGDGAVGDGAVGGGAVGAGPVAHPRSAPIVTSARRARHESIEGTPVRAHSDAVTVDIPRAETPVPVGAVLSVHVRRPNDPLLEVLRGHRRVETAHGLITGGVLTADGNGGAHGTDGDHEAAEGAGPAGTMAQTMARTMHWAGLAMAEVHLDPAAPTPAVGAVVEWWASV